MAQKAEAVPVAGELAPLRDVFYMPRYLVPGKARPCKAGCGTLIRGKAKKYCAVCTTELYLKRKAETSKRRYAKDRAALKQGMVQNG